MIQLVVVIGIVFLIVGTVFFRWMGHQDRAEFYADLTVIERSVDIYRHGRCGLRVEDVVDLPRGEGTSLPLTDILNATAFGGELAEEVIDPWRVFFDGSNLTPVLVFDDNSEGRSRDSVNLLGAGGRLVGDRVLKEVSVDPCRREVFWQ